ncbi:hypothetical protein MUO14_20805 [Halobacillus shinanisalinarum]|uniref:Uncharacterized protein n=1 Tax=Halobacillus shinanisalinarum TaxID=2932258 RepID=A0ABY4GYS6_9BACI|nr:hypothetical protein [Halobacillus shinanisalinarum]UOQ92825.1 hypothetical protein MUO14_20805 [Halobacillus shinanisalinarum]
MKKETPSPFDSFMWGEKPESSKPADTENKVETESQADWSTIIKEVQNTWVAVSPLVQPLLKKFKK